MFAFERYRRATTVDEAVTMLGEDPLSIVLAGGTDALVRLREGHREYANVVDVNAIDELREIADEGDAVRIGAGATFTSIMASDVVADHVPVIAEAAGWVAGPQIRNVATVGGNICNGSVCADSASALLVMDAHLDLVGPEGERIAPLRGFHLGPGKVELRTGELLRSIRIAKPGPGFGAAYVKYSMRQAMDIATIGCGAALCMVDGAATDVRLAFTVAAPTPVRCPAAEQAAEGLHLEAALDAVCAAVADDVTPRTSWRADKDFRLHIIKTLARRMMTVAAQRSENGS